MLDYSWLAPPRPPLARMFPWRLYLLQRPDAAEHATPDDAIPDAETFEAFFRRYEPRISTYLLRLVGNTETACDLSQEAFLRAWRHFASLAAHPAPEAWLFRVATNLALQHLRRQRLPVGAAEPLDASNDPASSDPSMKLVEREIVRQALLELPPKQRALLLLREVYGLSCAEVGAALGISTDATKMALCRARIQFRARYLRKEGQAE